MATPVLIVGHKNPDNDSIAGAVGFAYYKNEMMKRTLAQNPDAEEFEYIPCRLGPLPEESEAILSEYGIEAPQLISHVYARVCDVQSLSKRSYYRTDIKQYIFKTSNHTLRSCFLLKY